MNHRWRRLPCRVLCVVGCFCSRGFREEEAVSTVRERRYLRGWPGSAPPPCPPSCAPCRGRAPRTSPPRRRRPGRSPTAPTGSRSRGGWHPRRFPFGEGGWARDTETMFRERERETRRLVWRDWVRGREGERQRRQERDKEGVSHFRGCILRRTHSI